LAVVADLHLVEHFDTPRPVRRRLRVEVLRAEGLAGDSWLDKLDPYVKVRFGEAKRFQTPVVWNAGTNPVWNYKGAFTIANEETLEFVVMDRDTHSADDFVGAGTLDVTQLSNKGWEGYVLLTRPRRSMFRAEAAFLEEPAGKLFIALRWDLDPGSYPKRSPRERQFFEQTLMQVKAAECWGHEQLLLTKPLRMDLEQCMHKTGYDLHVMSLRLVSEPTDFDGVSTIWKISNQRFWAVLRRGAQDKVFLKACNNSMIKRRMNTRKVCMDLIEEWEKELQQAEFWGGPPAVPPEPPPITPRTFQCRTHGVTARIFIRSAANLPEGSWLDRLDPYAVVRFRGAREVLRTSVLRDAGGDPKWDCSGTLVYNGEPAIDITVWEYDKFGPGVKVAEGQLGVEGFCQGFEGLVPLQPAAEKGTVSKQKSRGLPGTKQMGLVLGIMWPHDMQKFRTPLQGCQTSAGSPNSPLSCGGG